MQALLLKAVAVLSVLLNPSSEERVILSHLSVSGLLIFLCQSPRYVIRAKGGFTCEGAIHTWHSRSLTSTCPETEQFNSYKIIFMGGSWFEVINHWITYNDMFLNI